ncbi:hypothetical protein [Allonocardiopsis opalescens]|uniref:Uncharacterized protein n=1 Tax=Allonocardiopsis opalescens TaxID=1144618 RepID=A0A2T0PVJ5_9ACTN|nr:hypothetical protein [Allonocardiopsis opalescens]PRX95554.1 hypothetical protein CLV72_109163 [Allonocardiopsis opalescens]
MVFRAIVIRAAEIDDAAPYDPAVPEPAAGLILAAIPGAQQLADGQIRIPYEYSAELLGLSTQRWSWSGVVFGYWLLISGCSLEADDADVHVARPNP